MVTTCWRNFKGSNTGLQVQAKEMEEVLAAMMGNSPAAWDSTYDDDCHVRDMRKIIKHYPAFKQWVQDGAALKRTVTAMDPHAS